MEFRKKEGFIGKLCGSKIEHMEPFFKKGVLGPFWDRGTLGSGFWALPWTAVLNDKWF